ncbi:TonB-dependent receptor [Novosphingobium colocasiae]|uniref:TonB-dependent receptor n=1 Tax=Novosphingobium colocasiae TaxID=1256513 RepID=UPI0035ADA1F1
MMMRHWKRALLGSSIMGILAAPAYAQSGATSDDKAAMDGEIVVTANKRIQNAKDVGLTIAVVDSAALASQRIANVADLAQATPGLTFAPTPNATPVYTLRGVGFYESSLAAYPDVSLYIDQVPLALPVMSSLVGFDLERVEVLKGPQGTLFGNNATGGAINFIAAKPTDTLQAGAEFGYGRFNTFEASGFVSGPLSQTLKARVAVKAVKGDAWQRSSSRNDSNGERDNIAARLLLDWAPTETVRFSLNVNGWRDQDDTQAPQKILTVPQNAVGAAGFGGTLPADWPILTFPNSPKNPRAADWTPGLPKADNKFWQTSLRSDVDLTDSVTVTSITAYSDLKFNNATDTDGTPLAEQDILGEIGRIKSFSQELRLSNGGGAGLRWVVGVNYENTKVNDLAGLGYQDATSAPINGITVGSYDSRQRMKNYAAFGNIEYDLSRNVTLKAGIRQTKAKRSTVSRTFDDPRFLPVGPYTLTEFFNLAYGFIYGGIVPTIEEGGPVSLDTRLNADGTPVDAATYLTPGAFRGKLNEDSTSWSVGVDFKPADDLLLYANVSKGYKAGSFPTSAAAVFTGLDAVTQESLVDYEVGFKTQLLDRKLSINGAAFYYDYKDKQLRAKFVDPIFGALDRLQNVPKSTIKGAEFDIVLRPTRGLALSASGTYLEAKVKDYIGTVGFTVNGLGLREPVTASFAGVRLPFSPKFQYSIRADYNFPLSTSLDGFVGAGVNGQTKSIGILTVSPADRSLYEINARALVNLNAGLRSSDGRWSVAGWAKNVFNKYYWTNTVQSSDVVIRYAGRPAEYGVTISMKY